MTNRKTKAPPYQLTNEKYLNQQDLSRLRDIMKRWELTHRRDILLIKFALATGARATELLRVHRDDFSNGCVLIRGIKGSNSREIPLSRGFLVKLKNYYAEEVEATGDSRLFPISYPRLSQIWSLYRPNRKRTFHSLRHTFALNLFDKTKDLRLVQLALGHRSIQNTMIYADYYYAMNELKRIHRDVTLIKY